MSLVPKMQQGNLPVGNETAEELLAISGQVRDLRDGSAATCALHDTEPEVVRNCTGGNPGSWGVEVSLDPGTGQVPVTVAVPVLVPVPTVPESVTISGPVPSPQPADSAASNPIKNRMPNAMARFVTALGILNVFFIFLSPSW
jgi:hypothetical protein